jgi:hypothetical protein
MWPTFNQCKIEPLDLSEKFRTEVHSFSGTTAQKLAATTVWLRDLSNVDFIPKEVPTEFPNLNGILIDTCTLPTVKNDLFKKSFHGLQYLWFYRCKIQTFEVNAFQYLVNLKWIRLDENQIESLPLQIFKNNPELIYINLEENKINSISSNFFKNLKKLQFVQLNSNLCINKDFGCSSSTCSVSQAELDSELSTCYLNCKNNMESALNSKLEEPIFEEIEKIKNDSLIFEANLRQEISQNSNRITAIEMKFGECSAMFGSDLKVQQDKVGLLEKNVTKLEGAVKNCEDQYSDLADNMNRTVQEIEENYGQAEIESIVGKTLSSHLEKTKEEFKESNKVLSLQVSEAKLLMENERLQSKLEKQAMELEMKSLKLELVELKSVKQELVIVKLKSERREAGLKNEMKALKDQLNNIEMSMRP